MMNINILLFAFVSLIGLFVLFFARQTIYALLWLIALLIIAGIWFVSQYTDIVGLALIVIYVGAVSMLFLYMVMLSDENRRPPSLIAQFTLTSTTNVGAITALLLVGGSFIIPVAPVFLNREAWLEIDALEVSINSIAHSYGYLVWPLIIIGFILTIGMIVAIDVARSSIPVK